MTGVHLAYFQESFQGAVMPKKSKRSRRSFSAEFNQAAVDLVVKPPYSFKAAAAAVGVAVKSLSELAREAGSEARTCRDDASTDAVGVAVKRLMKRPQRAEIERDFFKKPRRKLRGSHIKIRMDPRAS